MKVKLKEYLKFFICLVYISSLIVLLIIALAGGSGYFTFWKAVSHGFKAFVVCGASAYMYYLVEQSENE